MKSKSMVLTRPAKRFGGDKYEGDNATLYLDQKDSRPNGDEIPLKKITVTIKEG